MPHRFDRVFILNTWLHHIEMDYGIGVRDYNRRMYAVEPHVGEVVMGAHMPPSVANAVPAGKGELHGANRRFPLMHPYANPIGGNAKDQARCFDFITKVWAKPVHVISLGSDIEEIPASIMSTRVLQDICTRPQTVWFNCCAIRP